MNGLKGVLVWWLGRFYRLAFAAAAAAFGLLWAFAGLHKALLVLVLTVLGWLVGKWVDEGRPGGGLLHWLRRLFDGR